MVSRKAIKEQAKQQLKGNVGNLFLITLAFLGVAVGGTFVLALIPVVGAFGMFALLPPLMMGFLLVHLNVTYGEKPQISTLFDGFRNYFGSSILLYLLMILFYFLWCLLFIIPGIIKLISYSMSFYVLAENPNMTAREALNESKEIMHGHKWELFVLYLSFIPWSLLCLITFGLAFIYVYPYMMLTMTNFYHNIKRQA